MAAVKKKVRKVSERPLQPMSLTEFRAKLEGIEMFQGDDWCPTKEQWDLIRKMINFIEEEEPEVVYREAPTQYQPGTWHQQPQQPQQARQPQQPVGLPPAQFPESSLPDIDFTDPKQLEKIARPVAQSEQRAVKTPDIDTSSGNYNSPFA